MENKIEDIKDQNLKDLLKALSNFNDIKKNVRYDRKNEKYYLNHGSLIRWYIETRELLIHIYGYESRQVNEFAFASEIINIINPSQISVKDYLEYYNWLPFIGNWLASTIKTYGKYGLDHSPKKTNIEQVIQICKYFSRSVNVLTSRPRDRPPYQIQDEYDVQDLFHALLKAYFADVRAETWTSSSAGGSSRIDFVLYNEKIAIEVKMTRETLRDKKIGEELIVDIKRYQTDPNISTLVFFIYDPGRHIKNPDGLRNDLEKIHEKLDVRVVITT